MKFSQFCGAPLFCLLPLAAPPLAQEVPAGAAPNDPAAPVQPAEAPLVAPADSAAQGLIPVPDYSGDLWRRSHLTGDWGGTRTDLANKGFQLDVDWTQYFQAIVDGGRDETSAYGGHLDYLIRLDLMRMNVLPGALVTIRAESRYGDTVNLEAGPLLPVNTPGYFPLTREIDDDLFIAVTNLKYVQFLSEQFALFVGKIDTLDGDANEFASGRGKSQFMNAQFVFNSALALRLPYSTLGGGFLFLPTENFSLSGTVMNTLDSSTTTGFEDVGDGVTAALEASFRYRMGTLPGGANLGGLYSFDQDFAQIGGELIFPPQGGLALTTEDDTWAVYGSLWQYLFVEGPADGRVDLANGVQDLQGIGVFARVGFADEDTNPIEWTATAGLSGRGVLPSRDDDTLGLAYYYNCVQETRVGGFLGLDDHAQGLEFYYNLALTPAANLTFNVQATEDIFPNTDTTILLGARLNLRF